MSEKFPSSPSDDPARYLSDYFTRLQQASTTIRPEAIRAAAELLAETIEAGRWIYACGNGGSSAIANHLQCDFGKGIRAGTRHRPRIQSLAAHLPTITAIGNDMSFADIFSHQLSGVGQPGDLLITISSSGNSENIVRPLIWAKEHGLRSIALTGFDGGRTAQLAEVNIHVACHNYGIVEDVHQSVMHILAQYVRQSAMTPDDISRCAF